MIVDAHVHIWNRLHGSIGDTPVVALGNGIVRLGDQRVLAMPATHIDCTAPAELALAEFAAAGVDAAVMVQEPMDGEQNDYCLDVMKRFPGRFFCHALPDFFSDQPLSAQVDAFLTRGFRGIKIPANHLARAGMPLDSAQLLPVFARLAEAGAVVAVDFAEGQSQVSQMENILAKCPRLKVAIGHFGLPNRGGWPGQLNLCRHENVYLETGGITWLYRLNGYPFPDAINALCVAMKTVGMEKLMWGSDWPRTMIDITYRRSLDFIRLSDGVLGSFEKELILGKNAARLYGLTSVSPPAQPVKLISEW